MCQFGALVQQEVHVARNRHVSWAVALSAAAALTVALSACSSTAEASKAGTFYGSELALGNGK